MSRASVVAMLLAAEVLVVGMAIYALGRGGTSFAAGMHQTNFTAAVVAPVAAGAAPHIVIDDAESRVGVAVSNDELVHVRDLTQIGGAVFSSGKYPQLKVTRTSDGVRIERPNAEHLSIDIFGFSTQAIEVEVPQGARVEIARCAGADVAGVNGGVSVHSLDGHVTLTDLRGVVDGRSDDGYIKATNVRGDRLSLESRDGHLALENVAVVFAACQYARRAHRSRRLERQRRRDAADRRRPDSRSARTKCRSSDRCFNPRRENRCRWHVARSRRCRAAHDPSWCRHRQNEAGDFRRIDSHSHKRSTTVNGQWRGSHPPLCLLLHFRRAVCRVAGLARARPSRTHGDVAYGRRPAAKRARHAARHEIWLDAGSDAARYARISTSIIRTSPRSINCAGACRLPLSAWRCSSDSGSSATMATARSSTVRGCSVASFRSSSASRKSSAPCSEAPASGRPPLVSSLGRRLDPEHPRHRR